MCSRFRYLLFLLPFLASCTVLEDRTDCPCHVYVDLSDRSNYCADSVIVGLHSGSYSGDFEIPSEEFDKGLYVDVPGRKRLQVNVLDKKSSDFLSAGADVIIPIGEQCPRTYMFSQSCDISGEDAVVYVKLHKNYCGVSVIFSSPDPDVYDMVVSGGICGYDSSGIPMAGSFNFEPAFDDSSMSFFCIPRQIDGSLKLGITSGDGPTRVFALGNYILDSGYDWSKEDLDDIAISIDYSATDFRITIDDWTAEEKLEVII